MKGGKPMASNFQIITHRKKENLHMKLMGDFDGSSAMELLSVIKKTCLSATKVFIDTSHLNHIEPFGLDVLRHNLGFLKKGTNKFVFAGKNVTVLLGFELESLCPMYT
jgi:anti-anti-sigma regulatory factor